MLYLLLDLFTDYEDRYEMQCQRLNDNLNELKKEVMNFCNDCEKVHKNLNDIVEKNI